MAVTALACLVCWALAQKAEKQPAVVSSGVLVERLKALWSSRQYEETIRLADSLSIVFEAKGLRADWYRVLSTRAIAQKELNHPRKAIAQLLPILQAQTLDDSITARLYGLIGFAYLNADEFELGAWYMERNLSGLLRNQCKIGIAFAYTSLGFALKEQGDYRAALQYYLGALPQLRKEGNLPLLSEALINLGDISRSLHEYDAARGYYRQAVQEYPENAYRLEELLGWTDSDQGRYREALIHFNKSCQQGPCAADVARIMGYCAEMLGDTNEANRQYRLALESAEAAHDSAIAQSYIGKTLLRRKQPQAALLMFQQALHNLIPSLRAEDPTDNPQKGLPNDFWPIELLRGKAQAFRDQYTQTGNIQNLHHALSAISVAVQAIDSLRVGMSNEISGQDAVNYTYSTYETGIQIALEMERIEPGHGHGHISTAYEMPNTPNPMP
ncbi:MAG: tetratricopeptide repeat protein [Phycisphaerae bacterium]|nr:tetratricopeptide repeat protein [Saprospiraceae bacterium]